MVRRLGCVNLDPGKRRSRTSYPITRTLQGGETTADVLVCEGHNNLWGDYPATTTATTSTPTPRHVQIQDAGSDVDSCSGSKLGTAIPTLTQSPSQPVGIEITLASGIPGRRNDSCRHRVRCLAGNVRHSKEQPHDNPRGWLGVRPVLWSTDPLLSGQSSAVPQALAPTSSICD